MSSQKAPETKAEKKPAMRVDRERDNTPVTVQTCKRARCVGLHRAEGDYLCAGCKVWHPLPCPTEGREHR